MAPTMLVNDAVPAGIVNLAGSNISASVVQKTAARCDTDDFALCSNGGTVATDTSGTMSPDVTRFNIGNYDSGGGFFDGDIIALLYVPRAWSDVELQDKST